MNKKVAELMNRRAELRQRFTSEIQVEMTPLPFDEVEIIAHLGRYRSAPLREHVATGFVPIGQRVAVEEVIRQIFLDHGCTYQHVLGAELEAAEEG